LRNLLSSFVLQNRLARASELALLGAYANAEAVLMPNGRLPGSHQELDLLARIRVQVGDYESASQLWQSASQLGGRSYSEEIAEVAAWKLALEYRNKLILRISISVFLLTLVFATASFFYPKALQAFRDTRKPNALAKPAQIESVNTQQITPASSPLPTISPSPNPSQAGGKLKTKKKSSKIDSE
jgi:hypothetical protein